MDKPFLPLVISYIIGILLANYFQSKLAYLLVGLCLFIIIFMYNIMMNKVNSLSIVLIFIFLGMIITSLKLESTILQFSNERMEYLGVVEEILPEDENISKYVVKVKNNLTSDDTIDEKIRLNLIGEKTLSYGETIVFDGIVKEALNNSNPMLYNHRLNLLSRNIYASMTINDYSVDIMDRTPDFRYRIKEKFHQEINRIFDSNLKEDNRDIVKSMLLGDSSYLVDEELYIYRELGLGHILAVSGLHIGIISSFILFILRCLTVPRKLSSLLTIGIILLYSYLIGFPHSMMRAILMFSLLILTKLQHEHSNPINILSLSALIVLIANPFALFSLGFILSYTAVISLFLLSRRIQILFYPRKGYLTSSLSTVLAANIGLLPVQGYFFNYISIIGIIANLVVIPILSLSLILSVSMIVLEYIFPFFNIGLSVVLNILLDTEGMIREFLFKFSPLNFQTPSPNLTEIITYYLAIAILFKIIDTSQLQRNIKKSILIFCCFLIFVNFIIITTDDKLELHFIDVGQGDSLLLRTRGRDVLVDTGGSLLSNYVGEQITLPYLQKLGVNRLDGVVISHFDADHSGGLSSLIGNIKINNIYGSYIPDDAHLYAKIKESQIPYKTLKAGDRFRINEYISCHVLWPRDIGNLSSNNKSLVLLMDYKGYKILLTGDIEREVEQQMLKVLPSNIHILKVAHHGSSTSTSQEFLEVARPVNSIISAGRDNQFGHPHDDVIERLEGVSSDIYRTDQMGLVKVRIEEDIVIEPFIKEGEKIFLTYIYDIRFNLVFYLIAYMISKKLIILYERTGADLYELY